MGVAVKQKAYSWKAGFAEYEAAIIAVGEGFHIRTKGIRQVNVGAGQPGANIAAGTKGQGVYIRPTDNSLRLSGATASGDLPYGRIVELVGDNRGVPSGSVRIDLDQKDTLAAA